MNEEAKQEVQAVLMLLKGALIRNHVSIAIHDSKIAFFDTDKYLEDHEFSGFEVDTNDLVR